VIGPVVIKGGVCFDTLFFLQDRINGHIAKLAVRPSQTERLFEGKEATRFRADVEARLAKLELGWHKWQKDRMAMLEGEEALFDLFS
jgi:hypothetical protein